MFEKKAQTSSFWSSGNPCKLPKHQQTTWPFEQIFQINHSDSSLFFLQKDDTSRIGSLLNHQMAPQNGTTHLAESIWRIAAAVRSGFHFQVWEDPSHLAAMVAWMVCWWIFVGEGAGENREIWDIQSESGKIKLVGWMFKSSHWSDPSRCCPMMPN